MAVVPKIKDIARQSREDLAATVVRMGSVARRNKDVIAKKTEDSLGVITSSIGAGLAGYFMGGRSARIELDTTLTSPEEQDAAMKWGGYVDPDLAIGSIFALIGLSGLGGKQGSAPLLSAGSGILAYYTGTTAYDAARTRALDAAAESGE